MFFLVDAFTDVPFRGNPAGVYVSDRKMESGEMQDIAAYFNWSEISYLWKISENKFKIRWFSPKDEAPLCGHATLAASHIVFSENLISGKNVEFVYNNGTIVANTDAQGFIGMSFPIIPVFDCSPSFDVEEIIRIKEYERILTDGLVYVIVLKNSDDVKNAVPNSHRIKEIDARAIIVTASGPDDFDFCSRYFAPKVGLYEDPVCGSAHCRLSYYWCKVFKKTKMTAFQASQRSGILQLEVVGSKVFISGNAVTVAKFGCQLV